MERAAESYGKVVDLAPLHLDARISLSTLQQQLGRPEKALEALEPMYDPDTLAQDANAAQQVGHVTQKDVFLDGLCFRTFSSVNDVPTAYIQVLFQCIKFSVFEKVILSLKLQQLNIVIVNVIIYSF